MVCHETGHSWIWVVGLVLHQNERTVRERVGPYICGILPRNGQLNWSRAGKLQGTFNIVARNLEKMCEELRMWELRGLQVEQHFKIVQYEYTPQQVNLADCGVLSIKFYECFANGVPVDDVDVTKCGVFRRSFAKKIFDLSIPDTSTIDIDSE